MHTSGYLGPNLLNERSGITGEPLSAEELAAYNEVIGFGNQESALHKTVLDLIFKHTVGNKDPDTIEAGPFRFDNAWWGVARVNCKDVAYNGRKAPAILQVWGDTDSGLLDPIDYDDVFAVISIHPTNTDIWVGGEVRDILPDEARGLCIDALAAFARDRFATD
jgi:hypothetical protein